NAFDFAEVAYGVAVETTDEVDLLVGNPGHGFGGTGLAVPEVPQDALEHIVVAGDVAADEGRGMRKGNIEFSRKAALFLCGLDEGVEIVADHFRHAGGRYRDHLRLVHVVRVRQAVDHIAQAPEYRCIFGHGRRYTGRR